MEQVNRRVLKQQEIRDLLPEYTSERYMREKMIIKTALLHGLRNQETLKLKRRHIDLNQRLLEVEDGKGGKDRLVPIPDNFAEELGDYIEDIDSSQYIFASPYGGHFCPRYFQKMIRRRALAGGLYEDYIDGEKVTFDTVARLIPYKDRVVPHSLRHTYATMQLRNNISVNLVSKALGHSKTSTTSDLYGHLNVEDTRQGVNETFENQNWA